MARKTTLDGRTGYTPRGAPDKLFYTLSGAKRYEKKLQAALKRTMREEDRLWLERMQEARRLLLKNPETPPMDYTSRWVTSLNHLLGRVGFEVDGSWLEPGEPISPAHLMADLDLIELDVGYQTKRKSFFATWARVELEPGLVLVVRHLGPAAFVAADGSNVERLQLKGSPEADARSTFDLVSRSLGMA